MDKKGYLILEDGHSFEGYSFGSPKPVSGEVVFNTGMVGYPEGFTDPSYCGQILTMTYPLIGNYGVPSDKKSQGIPLFMESDRIQIQGLIVSSHIESKAQWQAVKTLGQWLTQSGVPALSGIDTRTLTKTIREHGVMKGVITFDKPDGKPYQFRDINAENLVDLVSTKETQTYGNGKYKILVFDCGLKYNQIRLMQKYNTKIIRVPWDFDPFKNRIEFDAVFISNGPGDPKMVDKTVKTIRTIMNLRIPIFGICLGNQILALAAGANTYKLKYGHRGQNQPVKDELTGKCYITTQNHGFAVDTNSLPPDWDTWFTNLNDQTNEGIRHKTYPFFSVQFHPESMPGPMDTEWMFEYFIEQVKKYGKR